MVGAFQLQNVVGRQKRGQALLPKVMASLDFSLGLRGGGVTQSYSVEMEGLAELGEGFWNVGEEEGVVVYVEGQRQAVNQKGSRQEIKVGQEALLVIEPSTRVVAGGVVQQIQQTLFARVARQPGMRAGIV